MTNDSCLLKKNNLYSPMICQPSTAEISLRGIHLQSNICPGLTLYWRVRPPQHFSFLSPVSSDFVAAPLHCFNLPNWLTLSFL